MVRNYQHTQMLLRQIKEMPTSGMKQKEVEQRLGLTGYRTVHQLLKRERKKKVQGIPKPRGREPVKTLQEYKLEGKFSTARIKRKGQEET